MRDLIIHGLIVDINPESSFVGVSTLTTSTTGLTRWNYAPMVSLSSKYDILTMVSVLAQHHPASTLPLKPLTTFGCLSRNSKQGSPRVLIGLPRRCYGGDVVSTALHKIILSRYSVECGTTRSCHSPGRTRLLCLCIRRKTDEDALTTAALACCRWLGSYS